MKLKQCSSCKKIKPIDDFYKDRHLKDGLGSACKLCMAKYAKEYRRKNLSKIKKSKRQWYIENVDGEYRRRAKLKYKYNITLEQYDKMFKKQNGNCAICGSPELIIRLSVDHDHETGKIRGLLCKSCNIKLGTIENKEFIKRVKHYLKGQFYADSLSI